MNIFFSIFLAACFLPILPILYFTLRNEEKPKNNLILSTTLPKEAWADERVLAITRRFRRELGIACLFLFLLYVPAFFIPYFSIHLTYILVWLIAAIIIPYIPYCKNVQRMRALKKENWYHPELKTVQVTDTGVSFEFENDYTFISFLLPLIVSLIPLLYPLVVPSDLSPALLLIICGCNAASILMFYCCHKYLFRYKSDRVNADNNLSANLTRVRKYYYSKFWLLSAWFCGIFSFSALLLQRLEILFLIMTGVLTVAIFITVLVVEFKIRRIQQNLNQTQPSEILMDEDDYWPYGAFYYNKNDNSCLINSRTGMGTTINMAKPLGKWIMVFTILILLAMPAIGIWMIPEEFSEVRIELTSTELIATHGSSSYEIATEDIASVTLLDDLPKCSRNWGTAMGSLLKGDFSVSGIDPHCKLCVNTNAEVFLLIRTNDEKYYLFGAEDTEEMEEVSRKLN